MKRENAVADHPPQTFGKELRDPSKAKIIDIHIHTHAICYKNCHYK